MKSSSKKTAGRRPRSQIAAVDTRSQILAAARSVFARRGLDGASVRDVAEAACVNNAMIYYHFKDKVELYRAVLSDSFMAFNSAWKNEIFSTALPVRTKIQTFIEELIRIQHADKDLRRILSIEFASCGQIKWLVENLFREGHKKLNALIKEGIKNGELKPVEPSMAGMMLVGMVIHAFIMQPVLECASGRCVDLSVSRFGAFVTDIFFDGLGAPRQTGSRKSTSTGKNRRRIA